MITSPHSTEVQIWQIDKLVFYARNPRKNDAAVDRMCGSIREFGFKIPVLARSDGEVVDGHLRLKAARKLGITEVPVILCDEWTPAQVKAFRLMVNRSVTWADWDQELLAIELQELNASDFDLQRLQRIRLCYSPVYQAGTGCKLARGREQGALVLHRTPAGGRHPHC
jgi:ParB-like chromosome segregation protein Spo0J